MRCDMDRYRPYVAHLNLDKDKEDELIRSVFMIIENGFDRAKKQDAVQHCIELKAKLSIDEIR